ncbi:LamG-like jellyroll fold domain-containing protein [Pelagibius sp.]|uniref:LamG-like jellyroll fold domain-containing protein n=1 Tax=Pelagibius sp. TaxID=1931238 RepID=UPI00262C5DD5|nr:LamG-like jellyroll fold domain-containing protein [Pelagibius sp.]
MAFDPIVDVSGCVLWYDADDLATITKDGSDIVQQWDDKSGDNNHASQSSASQRPLYVASGIGGLPSIQFDGSNDELDYDAPTGISGSQNRTVFVVFQNDDVLADHGVLSFGDNATRQSFHLVSRSTDRWGVGLWDDDYDSTTLVPGTSARVGAAKLDGTTLGDITLYLDGTAESASGAAVVNTDSGFGAIPRVGSTHGVSNHDGLISEVLIYNTALSDADRQSVEGYLAHKWGLEGNLPNGHPYKLAPPGADPIGLATGGLPVLGGSATGSTGLGGAAVADLTALTGTADGLVQTTATGAGSIAPIAGRANGVILDSTRRIMTDAMASETAQAVLAPVLLAKFSFDGGDLRLWTGVGPTDFDAETYTGAGTFGGVGPVRETESVRATGASFSLSGVPTEVVSLALNEEYQNRTARLWLGLMDSTKPGAALIPDPVLLFKGRMDVMRHRNRAEDADVSLTAENSLIDLERPRERRYTSQDQAIDYPDDKGLEFVQSLQDKELLWGRG